MVPEKQTEGKIIAPQSAVTAKTCKQTPLKLAIALSVMVFAVIVHMKGTTRATEAAVGAVVGAAAVGSHSLWEAEMRTAAVAITAVAGAIGTAAVILRSLVGIQSLIVSAVFGAIVGAAFTAIAKTPLQWVIDKTKRGVDNLRRAVSMINAKETNQTFPTSSVSGTSESAKTAGSGGDPETESSGSGAVQERPAVPGQKIEVFGGLLEAGIKSATFGSTQTQKVTDQSAQRDGSSNPHQTSEFPQTDRSSQIDGAHQTNKFLQTGGSPQAIQSAETDRAHQMNESPQTDVAHQTTEFPQTGGSPQTIQSPQTDTEFLQTDRPPQIEGDHQENKSSKTDRSPQIDGAHQTTEFPQTDGSPQTDRAHQTTEFPQISGDHLKNEFPKTDGTPQTIQSPETGGAQRTNEFPQTDGSPQTIQSPETGGAQRTNEFPQTDGSPQTIQSPETNRADQINEFPQTGGSPQTTQSSQADSAHQMNGSPQIDGAHQTTEFPQTGGSPQTIQSPQTDTEFLQTDRPLQIDGDHQANKSSKTDRSPQIGGAHQTTEFPQTDGSPQTDRAHQTTEFPQIDGDHVKNEFPKTDGTPQTIQSPETYGAQQTNEFPQTDGSPQTIQSPETDRADQINEFPQTGGSPQTTQSSQTDRAHQMNGSPQIDGAHQTTEFPQTGGSPQTIQSPETDTEFLQTDRPPQIDGDHQANKSSKTDSAPQIGGAQHTTEFPQTDGSPQTDRAHQTTEFLQIDGDHVKNEFPKTDGTPQTIQSPETDGAQRTNEFPQTDGSPLTIQSPETDRADQINEFPQTGGSPQTTQSSQADSAHQMNGSPQTDGAHQTTEFPQTGGSPQTIQSPQTDTEYLQTDRPLQIDGDHQANKSSKTDRSPQIGGAHQTTVFPQTNGSSLTDRAHQTTEFPQIDGDHVKNEFPKTDGTPQTIQSPETDGAQRTNEFPQTDGSPQTIQSPETDRADQINEFPQTGGSPQTTQSSQADSAHQMNGSPQIDGAHQTTEFPQTGGFPQTIQSPQTDTEFLQTDRPLQIDGDHQANKSSKIDRSPQIGGAHQTTEFPQTDGSPQTDRAHQTTEFPQIDGDHVKNEFPKTDGTPQTIQSPETDRADQINEFPQTGGSPQTTQSSQADSAHQMNGSPQIDGAHQTTEFPQIGGSPQTIQSPQTDTEFLQTDRPLQIDEDHQANKSSKTDRSPQTGGAHQTTEFPQTDGSPQTDRAHQTTECPQIDGDHVKNEFPKTDGTPQTIQSPETDRAHQINEFPQTGGSPQTTQSSQADRADQMNGSPQIDGAHQTTEFPQTGGSPQTTQSSQTDRAHQTTQSLQTDVSSQTNESLKLDESHQTNQLPQTNKSPLQNQSKPVKSETEKTTQQKQFPLFQESPENAKAEPTIKDSQPTDSTKNTGTANVGTDQRIQHENAEKQKLFQRLYLQRNDQLRAADVLQISKHTLQTFESCAKEELVHTFIQKLLMMDYRARYIQVQQTKQQKTDTASTKHCGDIFTAMSLSIKATCQSDRIHPMDVQMAVFYCADSFLKQMMVTKLSQCQFALPLLVPDPFTQQVEFPLWTFGKIKKSWKTRNAKNEIISQTQPIYKAQTQMVFFFRFGSTSSSKSHLMNSLINDKHNTFFHRNCPGSSRSRVLMDGVVEIAWFCPSGKNRDKFNECVAFCNLHGDAGDHEKQLKILNEKASVNVVLLPQLDSTGRGAEIIQTLFTNKKPLICLFTEDESAVIEIGKGKFKIGLKYRNQSDISEELRGAIKSCILESSEMFSLDEFKHSDIRDDVEHNEDCRRGREAAQQMMSLVKEKNLTEIKESFLPNQGKLWHQWCKKNKELHRPQGDELEKAIMSKKTEMTNIRKQQHESDISEFMKHFIKTMSSPAKQEKVFFLKWLTTLLDEHISDDLSGLHNKYNETWSMIVELKDQKANNNKPGKLKAELEKISQDLQAAAFGLEHIMREISQIYESCLSVNKDKKNQPVHFSSLPSLAAEMMISGFPLELMDGDAAHVPVVWISAVLDQLIQKLGDQRVFVLSVLGIQSSGKSTMLNAMFGLQFAVSAGRCTRGAFMQLLKVSDEMKTELNFDYILVVDTEGLRSLELAGKSTRRHDNELATFVVGLGNLTLINIFGENPSEMQDTLQIVVQAFLRMKEVRLNPSCVFVHQNVSDVTAGEKNMEGKRRLQETLDEMTKLAAKDEVCDAESFSDVISFDVQKDVKYFAQLWEGSPPMAPPNPNYCENVQELKKSIAFHASKSPGIKLTHLKNRIKDLWEALLNERFVFSFRNSLEISAYRKLETKYSKWSWRLRSAMLETENKLHNKIENEAIHEVEDTHLQGELRTTSEEVKKSMSDFFEKDTDAETLIQWKTSFEIKIKDLQDNIVRKTKSKLNEIIQQRILRKKIDAQRTNHENTLYEKSKELALKLKDIKNDEEQLKKEFDSFWEQSVKETIRDTPEIKDIDIMRDVKQLLGDIYGSVSVDHWKDKSNILNVESYNDYVKMKKNSGLSNPIQFAKETFGYRLSREDESQIKSLVNDLAQQTDKMIQSFNISKMGYNNSCIQQLIDCIKAKLKQHEVKHMKYAFKNEFFMTLVLYICNGSKKTFTDQQRQFREANDPVIYVEKKRQEYYSIFLKHIRGTASAAIFGEIISQKLKEPIEQSVCKKTARQLADEMTTNCPSLNGNRSKLEKHILKILAEEEEFYQLRNYIENPRDHFKSFIREEVRQYITDKFSVSVLPKMKENIEHLQQKIMKAAHEATVKAKGQKVSLWLKSFRQHLSGELIFSEKDLSGVKYDDVDKFELIEEVIGRELSTIASDIGKTINKEIFNEKLDVKLGPGELLINHFCQRCWVQCPFCAAICTNTIEKHDGDHSVPFHRVNGINDWHKSMTRYLCTDFCTTLVTSNRHFIDWSQSDKPFPYKDYKKAGGVYAKWSITPDLSELPYWKWIVCRFQNDLEKLYDKTFHGPGKIPDEWRKYTKEEAIESLDKCFG